MSIGFKILMADLGHPLRGEIVPPTYPPFLWLNSSYDSTETRGEPLRNKVLEGRRVLSQTSSLFVAVLHVRDSIREITNYISQTRRILYP